MTEKGSLDVVFDRSVERWTQLAPFVDAFTKRALNAPRFTLSVTGIEKSHVEKPPKDGTYRRKPKPYHYRNLAIHDHNLRPYPHLVTENYGRNITRPAARLKLQVQTTSAKD